MTKKKVDEQKIEPKSNCEPHQTFKFVDGTWTLGRTYDTRFIITDDPVTEKTKLDSRTLWERLSGKPHMRQPVWCEFCGNPLVFLNTQARVVTRGANEQLFEKKILYDRHSAIYCTHCGFTESSFSRSKYEVGYKEPESYYDNL